MVSGSLIKLITFVASTIPTQLSKGVVYLAIRQVGDGDIGYISIVEFIRYFYKIAQPEKLKASVRVIYNVACLKIIVSLKGIGGAFDLIGISKLEKLWFGEPFYIFDDNPLWAERNFIWEDLLKTATNE